MFSRLAKPIGRLAPRALALRPLAKFSSTPIPPSSSYPWEKGAYDPNSGYPMPVPEVSGDDHVSVIKEYGWRPLVGGLAGMLLFKEVHAVKEESILACLTLTGETPSSTMEPLSSPSLSPHTPRLPFSQTFSQVSMSPTSQWETSLSRRLRPRLPRSASC